MGKKTVSCVCGKTAEIRRLPVHGVFMIKCACGRRTGADTENGAIHFWDELMKSTIGVWNYCNDGKGV